MDRQETSKKYEYYQQTYARTLFALEQERKKVSRQRQNALKEIEEKASIEAESLKNSISESLMKATQTLNSLFLNEKKEEYEILRVAEYLQVGNCSLLQEKDGLTLPYIVPFLGHENLEILGPFEKVGAALQKIVLTILDKTAAGQIKITIFNPELLDLISGFSMLEQYEMISDSSAFTQFLDNLSREVVTNDVLLKGKYSSLLELRKEAKQPVGQLRIVIIIGDEWLEKDDIKKQVVRIADNGIRAGISFVFASQQKSSNKYAEIKKAHQINWDESLKCWRTSEFRQLGLLIEECSSSEINIFVDDYKKKAEKSTAVTIPFSSIEEAGNKWTESSADGITINLGKIGLDTVSLRLGDNETQLHNVIITGAPGKGKSNLLEIMIHSMCYRYSPDEVELYLLDFKDGLTFKPYAYSQTFSWLPHAKVLGLESARDFGVAVLQYIEELRTKRANIMKKEGTASVSLYKQKHPEARMPRVVVLIDEYQKLIEIPDDIGVRAVELIENIVRQGRACNIHLILASQTVSYGGAMVGKADSIYAAFPVRIGLQNNLQESYATFGQGNDASAKLRVRGEAVINVNFGANDSNQRFTVAYAEPNEMQRLRSNWCHEEKYKKYIPIIFGRNDEFHLLDRAETIKEWRRNVIEKNAYPILPCGMMLSVDKMMLGVNMSDNAGRNVALIGSGDGDKISDDIPPNYAIGLVENMAISLALQFPDGNAEFTFIDGLEPTVANYNGIQHWLRIMERFGFPVETIGIKDAPAYFVEQASILKNGPLGYSHFVICLALDRCANMSEPIGEDIFNQTSGRQAFQDILKTGPAYGLHVISWWANTAMYRDHIGYDGDGYINTKLLFKMDDSAAKDILGPFVHWEATGNRLLLHDTTDIKGEIKLIPMAPCSIRDVGKFEAVIWD